MNTETGYKRFAWKIDEDKDYMPERSCDTVAECKGKASKWIQTAFLSKESAPTRIFIAEDRQWMDTINEKDKRTFILRVMCLFEAWAKETGNYPKGIYKKLKEKEYKLY